MWVRNHDNHDFYECEDCNHEAYWDTDYGQQLFDYCPYCGAFCRIPQEKARRRRRGGEADG